MANDYEGGLQAPPGLSRWRRAWWWFDFLVLVNLARLRFVGVLLAIGFVVAEWDLLAAYYDRWTRPAGSAAAPRGDMEWFCPMHPTVVRDNSRDKCPVCFMPLSRRRKGHEADEPLPPGVVNRVQLSPYRVVLAGVATTPVDYQPLTKQVEAVGYVEFNERAQRTVAARVAGRIDKLSVNETGQTVDAGDELASLYSPELIVTVNNLLDARRARNELNVASARRRLDLLGIDAAQIDAILASGEANTHLTIRSPIGGHVIRKYVREGQYVAEGTPLYDIADLSTVWIEAQVFEDDLEFLPFDQSHKKPIPAADRLPVVATTAAFPEEPFHGTLAFIYPHVNRDTRTVSVRFELENPDHKLRPGGVANVRIQTPPWRLAMFAYLADDGGQPERLLHQGRVLAVPESAVIDTGAMTLVYRQTTPGVFEGVRVKLGPRMTGPRDGAWQPVLAGLNAGDRIVTSGSFLIDAETRLDPSMGSIYFGGGSRSSAATSTVRPSTPQDEEAVIEAALARLSESDRELVAAQRYCPILGENRLGAMGEPVKALVDGQPVFLCCRVCQAKALADPAKTLAAVAELKKKHSGAQRPESERK